MDREFLNGQISPMATLSMESPNGNATKAIGPAKSCVDASTILLRLAGKPTGKKGETV